MWPWSNALLIPYGLPGYCYFKRVYLCDVSQKHDLDCSACLCCGPRTEARRIALWWILLYTCAGCLWWWWAIKCVQGGNHACLLICCLLLMFHEEREVYCMPVESGCVYGERVCVWYEPSIVADYYPRKKLFLCKKWGVMEHIVLVEDSQDFSMLSSGSLVMHILYRCFLSITPCLMFMFGFEFHVVLIKLGRLWVYELFW